MSSVMARVCGVSGGREQLERAGEALDRDAQVLGGPRRRVEVDDQAAVAPLAQGRREVHRVRRLPDAAFLIPDRDEDPEPLARHHRLPCSGPDAVRPSRPRAGGPAFRPSDHSTARNA